MPQLTELAEGKLSSREIALVKALLDGIPMAHALANAGLPESEGKLAIHRAVDCLRPYADIDSEVVEKGPVAVRIGPLAFVRSMAVIFWSAIRHPFKTTEVDLSTGQVIRRY